jgi:hypothetical protein
MAPDEKPQALMLLGEHDVQCKDSDGLCQHRCGIKEHAKSILHEADIAPTYAFQVL